MTATPPESFAIRSWSLVRSKSLVVGSVISEQICSHRDWIASFERSPLRTIVSSLVIVTEPIDQRRDMVARSSLMSSSSVKTVPPVDSKVAKDALAVVTEAGCLDGGYLKLATKLVEDAGGKGLAIYILGNDK